MSWRRDTRFPAAALLSLWLAGMPNAHAQDPISVLELVIDGRSSEHVASFPMRNGVPGASLADWRRLGLPVPAALDAQLGAARWVGVDQLPGIQAEVDLATQTLRVQVAPELKQVKLLNLARLAPPAEHPTAPGLVLNYDVVEQHEVAMVRRGALLDARLFSSWGTLEHSGVLASGTATRRLNTSFSRVDPDRMRRWRVGDLVTGGLAWTRPVRLAGWQTAHDFGLRPDLLTLPTPLLEGMVSVPSTVDVLVNGVRQMSQPVEPGRFEIRQPPVVSGRGEVAIVVRDALGRETVQALPFYATSRQLAPGLTEFSVEAGRLRRETGLPTENYGPPVGSGSARRGVTQHLTVEGHAEATQGTGVLGGAGVFTVPKWGMVSTSLAGSQGGGFGGHLWGVGAEHQGHRVHGAVALSRASEGYRDVAATQGDPVPRSTLRVNGGWSLDRWGSVGLAWVDVQASSAAAPLRLASGSYSVSITASIQALVSAYRSVGGERRQGVFFQVMVPFGPRTTGSAGWVHDPRGTVISAQARRQAVDTGDGGWGVQSERTVGGVSASRQQIDAEYRGAHTRLGVATENYGTSNAVRLNAQGSLVYMAGSVHAAPLVPNSLAVVDLPDMPGVSIYRENRWVGRTNAQGQLVVPDLLPYQVNRLSIDPLDVPWNADIEELTREVRPVERSGVLVRYGIKPSRSALVVLQDAQGQPLPLGATARLVADGQRFVVGHDGQVYLRQLGADNEVDVTWAGGAQSCTARFPFEGLARSFGRIGPVTCE